MSPKSLGQFQRLDRFRLPRDFRGRNAIIVQAWWLTQATLFRGSPQILYGFRRWLLRRFGARIGRGVLIRPSASITFPWKVSIGDFAWVGDEVVLYSLGNIEIGSHAVVSQRSYLCTGSHDFESMTFDITAEPIQIGAEAWIATDVFVGPGVKIGDGTVVGARSSVFASLPDAVVAMGNPARVVRKRGSAPSASAVRTNQSTDE